MMATAPREEENIRSIKELVDGGLKHVPDMYIRPAQERPHVVRTCGEQQMGPAGHTQQQQQHEQRVPVISLSSSSTLRRPQLLREVSYACAEWGIFQVTNHGISTRLQSQLWKAAYHFFSLPTEAKMELVSKDPACPLLFFTGFYSHEKVREWKDTLGFKPNPSMNPNLMPYFLREPMLHFHKKIRVLAQKLSEVIFSSLDLDPKLFCDAHLSRETMAFNYYPACPEPDLTFGMSSHSDFGSLTIIMQDEVKGLQVRRGDAWIDVKPLPNSFIVILGDQIEILTNGHFKSVEHRVLTNQVNPRMSIACFYAPSEHEHVKPLDQFVSEDCPSKYKETKFSDYLRHGLSRGLNGKSNLQLSTHNLLPCR